MAQYQIHPRVISVASKSKVLTDKTRTYSGDQFNDAEELVKKGFLVRVEEKVVDNPATETNLENEEETNEETNEESEEETNEETNLENEEGAGKKTGKKRKK